MKELDKFLSDISSEILSDIDEFSEDIEKCEDREKIFQLMSYSPIIRNIYHLHLNGHIGYETAIQKMVVHLFKNGEEYRKALEHHLMMNPSPIIIPSDQ